MSFESVNIFKLVGKIISNGLLNECGKLLSMGLNKSKTEHLSNFKKNK